VATTVGVDFKQQVVLRDVYEVGWVKIAGFEVGVKLQQHLLVDVAGQLCLFFLGDVVVLVPVELNFVCVLAYKEVQVVASYLKRLRLICLVDSVLEKLGLKWGVNWADLFDFDFFGELREHVLHLL